MSTQKIIDSHNWVDFDPRNDLAKHFDLPETRKYLKCSVCNIIVFNEENRNNFGISDFNLDTGLKINTHNNKTIDITCDEVIIKLIIE